MLSFSGCLPLQPLDLLLPIISVAIVVYGLVLGVYRLYLSPLAKFPGPRLAALTQWYEAYYDLFYNGGGHFTFQIKKLHEKYGPIVRINPFELHIDDPDFYENIYTPSPPYDKIKEQENKFNMRYATFSTADGALHKSRRAALNPFFSKSRIQSHEPTIQSLTHQVVDRVINKYAGTNKELTLNDLFGCLTGDIPMELAFGHSYHLIECEDFKHPFTESTRETIGMVHWVTHLPWIVPLTNAFNEDLLMSLAPALKPIILFRREMWAQISEILHNRDANGGKTEQSASQRKTIFADILDSKLPPEELTNIRLQHEAISVVGAGFETTKWTLTVALYHILANSSVSARLQIELERAIPDPQRIPSWSELQKLPYLSACIEEGISLRSFLVKVYKYLYRAITNHFGLRHPLYLFNCIYALLTFTIFFATVFVLHLRRPLLNTSLILTTCITALRLSYGAVQRSPRLPPIPLTYGTFTIPAHTPISSDTYHMHQNPKIFPFPTRYTPERWLPIPPTTSETSANDPPHPIASNPSHLVPPAPPKAPGSDKNLSRYMVAFSRGSRMCLGMQLAYAELYLVLATVMRRLGGRMVLCEGVEEADVAFVRDFVTPVPRKGTRGVRVFVK